MCRHMEHHQLKIYQRKNRNGEKGVWYYRKRIPVDVRDVWIVAGTKRTEHVVSLDTLDKRVAEKRATIEHKKFLSLLEMRRQEKRVLMSESEERIHVHHRYEAYLRSLGAHPEQAPRVNAPQEDIQRYQDAVDSVKYGASGSYNRGEASTLNLSDGLVDLQHEVGLEYSYDDNGNEIIVPNKRYYEIEKDIEFLGGQNGSLYPVEPEVPNLTDALECYETRVLSKKRTTSERDRKNQYLRASRVTRKLAYQLGAGNQEQGMQRTLDSIMNKDAELFVTTLRNRDDGKGLKTHSSVKREITLIKAIWENAYKAYGETWPAERKRDNPFKVIDLGDLQKQHEEAIEKGTTLNKTRRPFRPHELALFLSDYLPRMKDELQLVTLIAEHAGCRIGDASGLLLGDCRLKTSATRPVPFLNVSSNYIRQVTKGGIEREIPLFGNVYDRLVEYTAGRKGPDTPLFPSYGDERGAGNASGAINAHIHEMRGDDVRLTFHSFRHTVQSKALASNRMPNKFPAYIGGWQNKDAKGLQAEYQTGGIPLEVLSDALQVIHSQTNWGRELVNSHDDEWA